MGNTIMYTNKHRLFNDPDATKLSFQLDQNAEEKLFCLSRYVDGFDLKEFTCYLLLSGCGWTDRVMLQQDSYTDETVSYRWVVSALATSTGKPVVFQPVFQKDTVVLHLDKDVFTINTSVDTDGDIEIFYPDYISGLNEKADKSELDQYYTKTVLDRKFDKIEETLQNVKNAGCLPNLLLNPNGAIWQRGTYFDLTLNSEQWQYCDDRWRYKLSGPSGAAAVVSKDSSGATKINIIGGGTVTRQQVLEEAVTGTLSQKVNGSDVVQTSFSGTVVEQTFTSNALIYWVKLETGEFATPFSPRPFGEELALCQRYYEKSYNYAVPAGSNTSEGVVFEAKSALNSGTQVSMGTQFSSARYAVSKRKSPTLTLYSKIGTKDKISKSGEKDVSANIVANGETGFYIQTTDTIYTHENLYFHFVADAEIYQ